MKHRIKATAMAVVAAVSLGLLPAAAPSAANSLPVATCDTAFSKKTPALFVHGLSSNKDMWSESKQSMFSALGSLQGVHLDRFDYEKYHFSWVTHPAIGQALAEHIMCLSEASLKAGGDGKVIVVGHSMGGLALRQAASLTVNGKKVADVIGLAITMGTPHNGSGWASGAAVWPWLLCRDGERWGYVRTTPKIVECLRSSAIDAMQFGSDQLRDLPLFPPRVPVLTLAGNVQAQSNAWGVGISKEFGDWVVRVASATSGYTSYGQGDGKKVIACSVRNDKLCSHTSMPESPVFHKAVRDAIEAYLAYAASHPAEEEPAPDPEPSEEPSEDDAPTQEPSAPSDGGVIAGTSG